MLLFVLFVYLDYLFVCVGFRLWLSNKTRVLSFIFIIYFFDLVKLEEKVKMLLKLGAVNFGYLAILL